jgi:hypothetical protein
MCVYLRGFLQMNGFRSAVNRENLTLHAHHRTSTRIRHPSTSLNTFVVLRWLADRSRVRGRLIHWSEVRRASFLSGRRDSPAVLLSLSLFVGRDILARSFGFFFLAREGVPGPPIVEECGVSSAACQPSSTLGGRRQKIHVYLIALTCAGTGPR